MESSNVLHAMDKDIENAIAMNIKFIFRKNDRNINRKIDVICCNNHSNEIDQSFIKHEIYYGNEECIVCELGFSVDQMRIDLNED